MKRWVCRPHDSAAVDKIRSDHGVSRLMARLLAQRGIEDVDGFLQPGLAALHDPFRMSGMRAAVERIRRALANRERILIYGDYDVDGTTGVVLLKTAVELLGGIADFHVPHRIQEGYGMRSEVIDRAERDNVRLVISVDTGIREKEVVDHARKIGIDVIITDHHLPEDEVPRALAVLNPNQPGCSYPEKRLCGAGVAFKLIQALFAEEGWEEAKRQAVLVSMLKIVAVATIADKVPLLGENRVFVRIGLEGLRRPASPGLKALLAVSGLLDKEEIAAGDVDFRIAPRINAAGRMDHAKDIVTLLTTRDEREAEDIAKRLDELNSERQRVQDEVVDAIIARLDPFPSGGAIRFIVVAGEGWHPGVIGIAASRIVERYHRPTLVLSVDAQSGMAAGSARSIAAFHMFEGFESAAAIFERFGGHKQAAGCTVAADRVDTLRDALEKHAASVLSDEDLTPSIHLDGDLPFAEINDGAMEEIANLKPHGLGNPTPVFRARNVVVKTQPRVIKESHLKLQVADDDRSFYSIGWRMAEQGDEIGVGVGKRLDLAFTVEPDTWWGGWRLNLRDFRPGGADSP